MDCKHKTPCEKCKAKTDFRDNAGQLQKMVSISEVLNKTKPYEAQEALENWRLRIGEEAAERIVQEAKERGRQLDDNFEQYHKTGSCKSIALSHFLKDYQIKYREKAMQIEELGIKGRLDAVLINHQGETVLIDFKTSVRVKKREYIEDYFLQVSAYYLMLDLLDVIKIDKAKIVMFVADQFTPLIFRLNKKQLQGYAMQFMGRLEQYRNENENL